ncbi:MAG TPA: PRC-barrel domain-containing protein [Streptosporangiaceae bacterium]|nr:PRC-barrel domain-containing protein [Streptosporangiaceae bacterium]
MAEETQFTIGAEADCSDGPCGEVRRFIIDPATEAVTHLVIEPKHRGAGGRLVPVDLIDSTAGGIRLRCTIAEFDHLDPAEETDLVEGAGLGTGMPGGPPMGIPQPTQVVFEDVVPVGETEVAPGDPVHATDGEIGQVRGFLVDPGDHRVTHVLLREGHLWGRKEVAIPVSAVTGVQDGIRLNITKQEVENLPPVNRRG